MFGNCRDSTYPNVFTSNQPTFNFSSQSTSTTHNEHGVTTNSKEAALLLPSDALELCKCNYCNCYVSVGPIRMIDNKVACGRCKIDCSGISLIMQEALAKQFSYPCRYKNNGCKSVLKWSLVDSHERVCDFKDIQCTITNCAWTGAKCGLKKHFEQNHPSEVICSKKGVTIALEEEKNFNFLYVSKTQIFLVSLSNDGEHISHQIRFCATVLEEAMYIYEISFHDSSRRVTYSNQKLHGFDNATNVMNTKLSVDILRSVFADSSFVTVSFRIKYAITDSQNNSNRHIECPVCLEPMVGEIIVTLCGHSFCRKCRTSMTICPCCRAALRKLPLQQQFGTQPVEKGGDIRNYSLEALIKKLDFDL